MFWYDGLYNRHSTWLIRIAFVTALDLRWINRLWCRIDFVIAGRNVISKLLLNSMKTELILKLKSTKPPNLGLLEDVCRGVSLRLNEIWNWHDNRYDGRYRWRQRMQKTRHDRRNGTGHDDFVLHVFVWKNQSTSSPNAVEPYWVKNENVDVIQPTSLCSSAVHLRSANTTLVQHGLAQKRFTFEFWNLL